MPIVDVNALAAKEPLPGWTGRYFHSEHMTFGWYRARRRRDEERARLHADIEASMAEFDRGEGIPAAQVIAELRAPIPR